MSLVMSVILIERVVQVTINPRKLRNVSEVERHLSVFSWDVFVSLSQRVDLLVKV